MTDSNQIPPEQGTKSISRRQFFVLALVAAVTIGSLVNFTSWILAAFTPVQKVLPIEPIRIQVPLIICGDGACEGDENIRTCPKDCEPQQEQTDEPGADAPAEEQEEKDESGAPASATAEDEQEPEPEPEPQTDEDEQQPRGGGGSGSGQQPFCVDSDGGVVAEVQGLLTTNVGQYTDICFSDSSVKEYYCQDNAIDSKIIDCGTNRGCLNGACVKIEVQPEEDSPAPQSPPQQPSAPQPSEPTEEEPADDESKPTEKKLEPSDIIISVVSSGEVLNQDSGNFEVASATWIKIYLPDEAIIKPIHSVTATIDGTTTVLKPTASYEGTLPVPTEVGQHELKVVVSYQDATSDTINYNLGVVSPIAITETVGAVEQSLGFFDDPAVERITESIVVPLVTILAVANVAVFGAMTATGFPYLMYLYSLLTHPTQLIARRKRKKWGVVFNSLSRLPIDLTIVRLLDAKTGRTVRSTVTDRDGRYVFITEPGKYKLMMRKAGYTFPSKLLKGHDEAIAYPDLYHGEKLSPTKGTAMTMNIPADPTVKEKTPGQIIAASIGRAVQIGLSIASIVVMVGAVVIVATPFVIAMLFVNVLAYALFRRLSVTRKPKSWGVVRDKKTKKPIHQAIVRIFDTKYNKLLESKITNSRGQYAFLVGCNSYNVTFEKPGYKKAQEGPIDLTAAKHAKEAVVEMDVGLEPEGN